ncbi:hypothetical protein IQ238_19760 [Pleurocapsales cyanobacterium LEGE 06147]|nr:hypothetical protein [Pleurocapsales cyanobacterium LEGE 06147]
MAVGNWEKMMKPSKQKRNFQSALLAAKLLNKLCLTSSISAVGLLTLLGLPARAVELFGNEGIQFKQDTIVEFEFIVSHGAYQSTFGVVDLDSCTTDSLDTCEKTPLLWEVKPSDTADTIYRRSSYEDNVKINDLDDFKGTPGDAVPEPLAEFLFKAGRRYAFYLESTFNGKPAGTVYSTNLYNSYGHRQALFNNEPPDHADLRLVTRRNVLVETDDKSDDLINGGVLIRWDDTGSELVQEEFQDVDFDDFIVGIGGQIDDCITLEQLEQISSQQGQNQETGSSDQ